jgi:hypothetical protein
MQVGLILPLFSASSAARAWTVGRILSVYFDKMIIDGIYCVSCGSRLRCSGGAGGELSLGSLPPTAMPAVTGMLVGVCSWLIVPLSWV